MLTPTQPRHRQKKGVIKYERIAAVEPTKIQSCFFKLTSRALRSTPPPSFCQWWWKMSYIFQNSPTIQQMKKNRKYRKTLRNYEGALEDGMMIMPEDLEGFPAPVLCSFCERPVITRTRKERSGFQWYGSFPRLRNSQSGLPLRNAYLVLRCNPIDWKQYTCQINHC